MEIHYKSVLKMLIPIEIHFDYESIILLTTYNKGPPIPIQRVNDNEILSSKTLKLYFYFVRCLHLFCYHGTTIIFSFYLVYF